MLAACRIYSNRIFERGFQLRDNFSGDEPVQHMLITEDRTPKRCNTVQPIYLSNVVTKIIVNRMRPLMIRLDRGGLDHFYFWTSNHKDHCYNTRDVSFLKEKEGEKGIYDC